MDPSSEPSFTLTHWNNHMEKMHETYDVKCLKYLRLSEWNVYVLAMFV